MANFSRRICRSESDSRGRVEEICELGAGDQELSGLSDAPIRWIVDDALKFVQREARRGVKYDGIILDPPKFGRGPERRVWEVYKSLPTLLEACRACLSDNPLFVVTTIYAVRASAIHIAQAMDDMMKGFSGKIEMGELVTREQSAGRLLYAGGVCEVESGQ
ncbi:MAG: hypothetical protein U0X87_04060 [Anaerolineales bacterium]